MHLPKWTTMTNESKAAVKRGAIIGGGAVVTLLTVKTFPLLLLGGTGYLAWVTLNKRN